MFNFIKNLFSKEAKVEIRCGDVWYRVSNAGNPFREAKYYVRVKDYKDEWVNYKIGLHGGDFFQDEVMKENMFREVYKLHNRNNQDVMLK